MTRDAYLAALRTYLRGLQPKVVEEILADYGSHFDEGRAAGRRDEDIAAGLGDPARLARELRAEAGLKRWDQERSVSAGAAAILAILSLGAIDVLILFPILLVVVSLMFVAACGSAGLVVAGIVFLFMAPFGHMVGLMGGFINAVLGGVGFLGAGVALGALLLLIGQGLTNLLMRYGRFHVRLLKPVAS